MMTLKQKKQGRAELKIIGLQRRLQQKIDNIMFEFNSRYVDDVLKSRETLLHIDVLDATDMKLHEIVHAFNRRCII